MYIISRRSRVCVDVDVEGRRNWIAVKAISRDQQAHTPSWIRSESLKILFLRLADSIR